MSFTLLNRSERTARKRHRCAWCWQHIAAGERYVDERSVYDGEFQAHHFHPECEEAMHDAAREEGGTIEWVPGMERPAPKEQQATERTG